MRDLMNRNPATVVGSPALVAGVLSSGDQALSFDGLTDAITIPDSASLSITESLSIECWLTLDNLPGATRAILSKPNAFSLSVDSTGHVIFDIDDGGSGLTLTSTGVLVPDEPFHIVAVLNQNYAGAQSFGKSTEGASNLGLGDASNNKIVGQYELLEPAILQTVHIDLRYFDEIWAVDANAVVYADDGADDPGELVTVSAVRTLNQPEVAWRDYSFIPFTLTPALAPAGLYHLGLITDTLAGPLDKGALQIGYTAGGGVRATRSDSVGSASDPFGAVSSAGTEQLDVYCEYEATSRTGLEGKAAIYLNGALDSSSPGTYTGGIQDSADDIVLYEDFAAVGDDLSIWDRPLTGVEVATHYLAR